MKKHPSCLVVTGGELDLAFARSFLEKESFDLVIAVDGGLRYADALGLKPDWVVGDFDTVEETLLKKYCPAKIPERPDEEEFTEEQVYESADLFEQEETVGSVETEDGRTVFWEQHHPEKNETDTELARSRALELGCGRIVFLGATGGRLDHMIANIHMLSECLEQNVHAELVDAQNRLYLIRNQAEFEREKIWGKYISFFPYTDRVRGIHLAGFKYLLHGWNLKKGVESGLCLSNELAGDSAKIWIDEGILVCVESRDKE
ncbi:thiamine diphosphokinase [Brotaphodocola sp.]|uniref:thiamine diphosphokinase n=1 Tax=Brotaphodocola sp. TaxID=3073577 RepID=UPI003D7EA5F7